MTNKAQPRLTLKRIQDELQSLSQESIDENSSEGIRYFTSRLAALSKKAEVFRQLKDEEFLCQELAPLDNCTANDSVIEI